MGFIAASGIGGWGSCADPKVYDEHGEYKMRSFESMRQASPGIFELCWCRKTAATNCTDSVDFSVSAGSPSSRVVNLYPFWG